jgi:hypothetical protein
MFSFSLIKAPPEEVLPLAVKGGFAIWIISPPFWKVFRKQGGGAILLLWPVNFFPFGIKRQKQRNLRGLVQDMNVNTWVEQRKYDTNRVVVEALPLPSTPFPFQSKTKHRNTLGNTLVLALAQEE